MVLRIQTSRSYMREGIKRDSEQDIRHHSRICDAPSLFANKIYCNYFDKTKLII
jgi:hypothetical protein